MSIYKDEYTNASAYARALTDSQLINYYQIERDRANRYAGTDREDETLAVAEAAAHELENRNMGEYV